MLLILISVQMKWGHLGSRVDTKLLIFATADTLLSSTLWTNINYF